MRTSPARTAACLIGLALLVLPVESPAQEVAQSAVPAAPSAQDSSGQSSSTKDKSAILLTIFFRHDQSKTLGEINDHLKQTGYYAKFPPAGIEVRPAQTAPDAQLQALRRTRVR